VDHGSFSAKISMLLRLRLATLDRNSPNNKSAATIALLDAKARDKAAVTATDIRATEHIRMCLAGGGDVSVLVAVWECTSLCFCQ